MPLTRREAKLREEQGIAPSPQKEIPRELSGTQRRRKKKPAASIRATITPESDGDVAIRQDQDISTHALREGNAGGYVESASSTRGIREQQDSLPVSETHDMAPQCNTTMTLSQQPDFEIAAAAIGTLRGSPPVPRFIPAERIHTPPHSPTSVPLSITQTVSGNPDLADDMSAQTGVSHVQSTVEQATPAQSVSPKTDGQKAAVVSPPTMADSSAQTSDSPFATNKASSINEAPPITMRDWSTSIQTKPTRDQSVQTTVSATSFRPLGLYGFRSEFALPPGICSMTIHLGSDKEVRVSNIPAEAMHEITGILHNHRSLFDRNWLTPREEAAAAAPECLLSSATKRKRDDQVDSPHSAQRRRIEIETEDDPTSPSTPTPPEQPTRKGIQWLRQMALKSARTETSRSQPALADLSSLIDAETERKYSQDGGLRLIGQSTDNPDDEISGHGTAASIVPSIGLSSDNIESQPLQAPTPDQSSWRLGTLFNTAKRFIPSIRRQGNLSTSSQTIGSSVHTLVSDDASKDSSQRVTRTEPRHQDQRSIQVDAGAQSNFAQRLRDSQQSSKKPFRNKENIAELQKLRAEKERMRAEWAKLEEECRITELARKDVEAAHRAAYAAQTTGCKRPAISPQVIPNPPGVSYGLDPAYFDYSSSEDEEESSPSMPPFKVRRTQGPDTSPSEKDKNTRGSGSVSIDYDASKSPGNEATHYNGPCFSESPPNVFIQSEAHSSKPGRRRQEYLEELVFDDGRVFRLSDPNFNHSGHFEIPLSPTSSEEDETFSSETPAAEQSLSPVLAQQVSNGHDTSAPAETSIQPSKGPASEQPSLATILQSSNASTPAQAKPVSAMQPTVTIAPTQKGSTTTPRDLTTPAPKQVLPATDVIKNIEASKTLERNRQMLRAQLAEYSGRSVLSPKDILRSSPRSRTSSPVRAATRAGVFSDPPTKLREQDDFNILGAASRVTPEPPTSPKSPGQKLAETLPSIGNEISSMQGYNEYQQELNPKVQEDLKASWAASGGQSSWRDFSTPFTDFLDSLMPEDIEESSLHDQQGKASVEDQPDDYDDASFYENDQNDQSDHNDQGAGTGGAAVASMELSRDFASDFQMDPHVDTYLNTLWTDGGGDIRDAPVASKEAPFDLGSDFQMDSGVATYLKALWTDEDEAYASEDFREDLPPTLFQPSE
ncbi:MAG: hypothetical protein Q9202_003134 [Teloschistes flavicans]